MGIEDGDQHDLDFLLTLRLFWVISFPFDVCDILNDLCLVELMSQHLWCVAIVVSSAQNVKTVSTLTNQELEARQVTLHRSQVRWSNINSLSQGHLTTDNYSVQRRNLCHQMLAVSQRHCLTSSLVSNNCQTSQTFLMPKTSGKRGDR